ncbi:Esterase/lipase superfamily enzyme [Spirosomataceae bacterium TFI 002]|nr:Esterase/lipase superfamily enzyme [Spirosomataceae bacterium TFI 002]
MQEEHINYYSHSLGRNIEVVKHGHWGYPVLLFPTSMGNVYQNKDFGLLDTIKHRIDGGELKIFSVASIDFESFYGKHLSPNIKIYNYYLYAKFLHEELVPYIKRECNVDRIGIAGCSFGAYHAANYAFKYPDDINFLISMSGAYSISSFMNGYYDDNVYFNNPVDFMKNAESWKYNHMKIVLGTSEWDICKKDNIEMSRLLGDKQIAHWYDEKKWIEHDWPLWKMAFPEYLNAFHP